MKFRAVATSAAILALTASIGLAQVAGPPGVGAGAFGTATVTAGAYSLASGGAAPLNGIYLNGSSIWFDVSNGSPGLKIDNDQNVLVGGGATPTVGANACGTSTQGVITAGGAPNSFLLTVGTAAVTSCVITFPFGFISTPRTVELTPANSTAAATGTTLAYVSAVGTGGLTITGSALAGAAYYVTVN